MTEYFVPLFDHVILGLFFMLFLFLFLLVFLEGLTLQRIADRYRLKYSFDREIESKEISKEDTDLKLNKREQRFRRRVFKD